MLRWVIALLLNLYLVVLIARMVLSWVRVFAPQWRPRGPVLVVANGVYALTDPPLKLIGRWVRPVRIGDMMLDLAFTLLFLAILVLQSANAFNPW